MRIRDWSSDVCSSDLPDRVDLKDYPAAATERIIDQRHYRRDPIIRGSPFAGGAFLWSDIHNFMQLDRRDRASFELGRREGLNEGITVPYRSEEHTSELQSLMRISYAVFCLKKKKQHHKQKLTLNQ